MFLFQKNEKWMIKDYIPGKNERANVLHSNTHFSLISASFCFTNSMKTVVFEQKDSHQIQNLTTSGMQTSGFILAKK